VAKVGLFLSVITLYVNWFNCQIKVWQNRLKTTSNYILTWDLSTRMLTMEEWKTYSMQTVTRKAVVAILVSDKKKKKKD
jgi:hypothetical protein